MEDLFSVNNVTPDGGEQGNGRDTRKKRVFVIDGYGQIYRSYYAFMRTPLRDRQGNNISAVFGFFNTLMSLVRQYRPDYLAVALDSVGKTFRHELYPLYKANREKTPEDLHSQVPVIVGLLDAMKIGHFEQPGMEADDIIATLCTNAGRYGIETVMVTGDKDLLQLVDSNVKALRPPLKGEHDWHLCGESQVLELFGVRPDQITDYLTILGDSSDNVPGITGMGAKGAANLLSSYGTLDNAYAHLDEMSASVRKKLEDAKDTVELSRTLIKLKNNLFSMTEAEFSGFDVSGIDWAEGAAAFRELGSDRLVAAARRMLPSGTPVTERKVKTAALTVLAENGPAPVTDVPAGFIADTEDLNRLAGYDLKPKLRELRAAGKTTKPWFDVMIAAWLLDSNAGHYEFEEICLKYLGTASLEHKEAVRKLCFVLDRRLEENRLKDIFYKMEMPLLSVLADMESAGILLDQSRLTEFEKDLTQQCGKLEQDIWTLCGHPFNLNSPKQLQEVLFVERDLPTGKKTKSGFSTDSDVLEELSYTTEDPVPSMLLRYRALNKLLSTYILTLPSLADPADGRVHTTFLQTGTATGRLSSKNPNLQNIPIRTEEGRRIRDAFVPADGCVLLSADYSQIELAVLADVSGDSALKEAFINGKDVHRETAALIFGIMPELVTSQQRRIAKTINFGVIYGMSAFRLAGDLKIPRKEAQGFIDTYFERYSGVAEFIEKTKKQALEKGSVLTVMGHVRAVPDITSSNRNVRQAAERAAVNSVIQGTAAEIVKRAMLAISAELEKQQLVSRLLLQVHDEVILEVPYHEKEQAEKLVRTCMENAAGLSIPLRVGIETGRSWGEMH